MADAVVLGVFEDFAQRDFHLGLLETQAATLDVAIDVESRVTRGCRFSPLAEYLGLAAHFDGVLLGVDGGGASSRTKRQRLAAGLLQRGIDGWPEPCLVSVAEPSIEAWLMADPQALPETLAQLYGQPCRTGVRRPAHPRSERTAKQRLFGWSEALLGDRLLRGGAEHAEEVGRRVALPRLGRSRNRDLCSLLQDDLPQFLRECVQG